MTPTSATSSVWGTQRPKQLLVSLDDQFSKKERRSVQEYAPIMKFSKTCIVVGVRLRILVYSLHGTFLRALRGHTKRIFYMDTWEDTLVSAAMDDTVRIWDLITGQCIDVFTLGRVSRFCITTAEQEMPKNKATFEHDARTPIIIIILTPDEYGMRIRRLPHPKAHGATPAEESNRDSSFNRDIQTYGEAIWCLAAKGTTAVTGGRSSSVCVWDIIEGRCKWVLIGHREQVWSVDLDERQVYSASADATVRIWSMETGECAYILRRMSPYADVWVSPSYLVSRSNNGLLCLFNPLTGVLLKEIPESRFRSLSVQHDDRKLLFGGTTDGYLTIWDMPSHKDLQSLILGDVVNYYAAFHDRFCASLFRREGLYFIKIWEFRADSEDALGDIRVDARTLNEDEEGNEE